MPLAQKRVRERGGRGTTDSTAASGIPFCPASWKQLENGCGMLGDRERQGERAGKKKVLAERANGESNRYARQRTGELANRRTLFVSDTI